jgi:hypothetical protein
VASMTLDPDLLTAEADPLLFLQLEGNNVPRAAYKLALSWQKRRACFGDMAFLPMSQVGMGALTEQVALGHSCMQQLPNDKHGNAVFVINAPKITSSLSTSGARALFYQLHLAKAVGGVVFLFLACGNPSVDEMTSFFGLLSELVNDAVPSKARRVHILSLKSEMPSTMVKSAVELILEKHLSDHVVVTEEISAQSIAPKLAFFGLTKEGLPPFLGGTLGTEPPPATVVATGQLKDATDDSVQQPSPQEIAKTQGFSIVQPQTDPSPPEGIPDAQGHSHNYRHQTDPSPPEGIPDAQGHLHYYQHFLAPPPLPPLGFAVANSGPYYPPYTGHGHFFPPPPLPSFAIPPSTSMAMPFPCSIQSLDQKQDSNMMRLDASQVAARTSAVANSIGKVPSGGARFSKQQQNETGEVDLTAKRERNAYYSRRKYARKKIEIEVRQEEARRLQEQNTAFQREHERLEALLLRAKTLIHEMQKSENSTGTSDNRHEMAATAVKAFRN